MSLGWGAAVEAGLGITLRTATGLPGSVVPIDGLPAAPMVALSLHDGGRQISPAVSRLRDIVMESLAANLPF